MAMKYIKCPHCGATNGPKAVNENIKNMPLNHTSCFKCHKKYAWTAEYGKLKFTKISIFKE